MLLHIHFLLTLIFLVLSMMLVMLKLNLVWLHRTLLVHKRRLILYLFLYLRLRWGGLLLILLQDWLLPLDSIAFPKMEKYSKGDNQ